MATVHEPQESKTLSVRQAQEVVVRRKNDIGVLFELATLVADQGVNVLSVSGDVCGEDCLIRLITDNNQKTKEVLAENNFTCEEEETLLMELPHRPGMLKQVTKILTQEGLDIRHLHAAAGEQGKCLLVLHSSNDQDALNRLRSTEIG